MLIIMKDLGWLTYLVVITAYGVVSLVTGIWYVVYNRGFIGKKISKEMLPAEWSNEKKDSFIEECAERRKNSKWAMLVLIPIIAAFFYEAISIYMLDGIRSSLGI